MQDKVYLTQEGYDALVSELEERITVTRVEIADEIQLACEQGDLSENAAYKAAMETKRFNETRISEIEELLKVAEVKAINTKNNKIDIGEKFKLIRVRDKQEVIYTLVGGTEANAREGKISIDSPIGKAVTGRKFGDRIKIKLPNGEVEFDIVQP